jgi:hypothetical protein
MARLGRWLLIAVVAVTQGSCSTSRWRGKRKSSPDDIAAAQARRPLQRIGVVTLVNEADGFVLIDSGSLPTPADGARLRSYTGPVASGELKASAVRRRPFVVADIVEGTPRAGDEIFEAAPQATAPAKPK